MKSETGNLARFAESQTAERLKTFAPCCARQENILAVADRSTTCGFRFADSPKPCELRDRDHRHYRKMRRRLRKLMDLCGAVRNYDIAIEILEAAGTPAAGSAQMPPAEAQSAGRERSFGTNGGLEIPTNHAPLERLASRTSREKTEHPVTRAPHLTPSRGGILQGGNSGRPTGNQSRGAAPASVDRQALPVFAGNLRR